MKKRNLSHCQVSHRELCFLIILNAARLNSSRSENLPAYVSSYWVWGAASDEETDYVQLKALIQSFRCSAMTRRFTARVRWNNSTLIFLQDRIYDALTVPRRSKFRKSCSRSRQVQVSSFIMSPLLSRLFGNRKSTDVMVVLHTANVAFWEIHHFWIARRTFEVKLQ